MQVGVLKDKLLEDLAAEAQAYRSETLKGVQDALHAEMADLRAEHAKLTAKVDGLKT